MNKIILLLSICFGVVSCSQLPEPEFKRVDKLKLAPSKTEVIIGADAVYFNPFFLNITVKKLNLDVFMEGNKIGEVNQEVGIELVSNQETIVPIEITLKKEAIAIQLMNSILNIFGKKPNKFVFKGTSTASIFGISKVSPVDFETEIDMNLLNLVKE